MKFIWLITIFLICLRLCFCFLCCNTSLPALPAFIQCLTDSHLGEQTEGFHKKHAVPWALQAAWDPTWTPGEGRSSLQMWDPLSLQFHSQSMHSIQALLAGTPFCNISFICQTTVLYLDYSIVILLLPQNSNRQIPISLPRSWFQLLMYLLEVPKRNFIFSFLDCPNNKK